MLVRVDLPSRARLRHQIVALLQSYEVLLHGPQQLRLPQREWFRRRRLGPGRWRRRLHLLDPRAVQCLVGQQAQQPLVEEDGEAVAVGVGARNHVEDGTLALTRHDEPVLPVGRKGEVLAHSGRRRHGAHSAHIAQVDARRLVEQAAAEYGGSAVLEADHLALR